LIADAFSYILDDDKDVVLWSAVAHSTQDMPCKSKKRPVFINASSANPADLDTQYVKKYTDATGDAGPPVLHLFRAGSLGTGCSRVCSESQVRNLAILSALQRSN
jgi:hypothetical protein